MNAECDLEEYCMGKSSLVRPSFCYGILFSYPLYIGQNIRCCDISTLQILRKEPVKIIYFFYSVSQKYLRTRWFILRRWKGNAIFYPFFLRFIFIRLYNYTQSETKESKQTTY